VPAVRRRQKQKEEQLFSLASFNALTFSCASRRNSASFRSTSFGSAIEFEPFLLETARGTTRSVDELVVVSRVLLLDPLALLCLPPRAQAGAARRVRGEAMEPLEVFV